jgi:hypothetical protein
MFFTKMNSAQREMQPSRQRQSAKKCRLGLFEVTRFCCTTCFATVRSRMTQCSRITLFEVMQVACAKYDIPMHSMNQTLWGKLKEYVDRKSPSSHLLIWQSNADMNEAAHGENAIKTPTTFLSRW